MRRLLKFSIVLFILAGVLFLVTKIYRTRSRDSAGPEITVENESISVSIHDPESVLLAGVTAFDKKDGDVTQSIVIERISNFLEKDTRIVTYAAFDRDNHVTRASREITYTDYDPPEFASPPVFPLSDEPPDPLFFSVLYPASLTITAKCLQLYRIYPYTVIIISEQGSPF